MYTTPLSRAKKVNESPTEITVIKSNARRMFLICAYKHLPVSFKKLRQAQI
jgi:hypothetical protein